MALSKEATKWVDEVLGVLAEEVENGPYEGIDSLVDEVVTELRRIRDEWRAGVERKLRGDYNP